MSEPDSKLSNWCRHLLEAYVTLAASERPHYTAKGGANSKLASPVSTQLSSDDCEAEGYAGGAEGENEREDATPSQELVQLIQDVQPSASGESLLRLVRSTGSPHSLRPYSGLLHTRIARRRGIVVSRTARAQILGECEWLIHVINFVDFLCYSYCHMIIVWIWAAPLYNFYRKRWLLRNCRLQRKTNETDTPPPPSPSPRQNPQEHTQRNKMQDSIHIWELIKQPMHACRDWHCIYI